MAVSISSISAYYNFDLCSYKLLSVLNIVESASFLTSTNSLLNLSSFLNFSALFIISLISYSLKPPELYIWIEWSLFVALSFAETCTIPLASISNVTSIYGTPLGAGGIPLRSNCPSILLSAAISRSPWNTLIDTTV